MNNTIKGQAATQKSRTVNGMRVIQAQVFCYPSTVHNKRYASPRVTMKFGWKITTKGGTETCYGSSPLGFSSEDQARADMESRFDPSPDNSNRDRRCYARIALRSYLQSRYNNSRSILISSTTWKIEDIDIIDLVTDLHHLAHALGMDWESITNQAYDHFVFEVEEEKGEK